MPRYYHGGRDAVDSTKFYPEALEGEDPEIAKEEKKRIDLETRKHHPLSAPHRDKVVAGGDGKLKIRVPALFCQIDRMTGEPIEQFREWTPGSIAVGWPGYGFHVVPLGGYVDLDPTLSEKAVKAAAPHLLTEEEYEAHKARKSAAKPAKQ